MLVISISKLPQNFTSEVSLLEVKEVAGMVKVGASVYRI